MAHYNLQDRTENSLTKCLYIKIWLFYIGNPVNSKIVYFMYDITRSDVHVPQSIERHVLCNTCINVM